MIYQFVLSDDTQFAEFGKELSYTLARGCPNGQKIRHFRPQKRNRLMVQQPSIFVTCKAIRAEGLRLFYQLRHFHFVVNDGILTLKMLLRWFHSLNTTERFNIRRLTVVFLETFHMEWVLFLTDLTELLPPRAVVGFHAALKCDIQKFQLIKATWDVLKPKARVPEFERVDRTSIPTQAKFSMYVRQAFESEGFLWPSAAFLLFKDEA